LLDQAKEIDELINNVVFCCGLLMFDFGGRTQIGQWLELARRKGIIEQS
jgi:hypothetical protein